MKKVFFEKYSTYLQSILYESILYVMKCIYIALCLFIVSCASNTIVTELESSYIENEKKPLHSPRQSPLLLTFAGDIMAHNVNYNMKDYSLIYEDVEDLLHADDISFANFEAPVNDALPNESYPTFNVNSPYALAAIKGGFDAFSLSNNHTNDQGLIGIKSSKAFFDSQRSNGVYSAGIKKTEELSYDVITTQGWTVLFVAITEIVNSREHLDTFDVYSPTKKRREELKNDLLKLQSNNPHDIFVLSVHVADPEYDIRVSENRREWFYELLASGVDIVWGNHPHVTKEWELIKSDKGDKLIMYSIGNTISGQNYHPNYEDPLHPFEDTGTSIFLHLDVREQGNKSTHFEGTEVGDVILSMSIDTTIIVTHKDENKNMLIKKLTPEFISQQNKQNRDYYRVRLQDMEKITGKTIWQ